MTSLVYVLIFNMLLSLSFCHIEIQNQGREYWYKAASLAIEKRTSSDKKERRKDVAKNIIMFVGDGMGMSTLTAARILKGQRQGRSGEDTELVWEQFPAVALAKTYNADAQIGESSACATALMCGVKANYETLGVDASARFEDCSKTFQARVPSLLTWAQEQGKLTGIVTTSRVSHATPAALFAHAPSRFWEDDAKVPLAARASCKDITRQLLEDEPGSRLNVILGGGRRHFTSIATLDPEFPNKEGKRLDGRNLISDWMRIKRHGGLNATYVMNKEQLQAVDPAHTGYLLGLFSSSHMDFEAERDDSPKGDPSLSEMTSKALDLLMRGEKGFFLMVEGGRIDHAHHLNNAYRALDETLSLDRAVAAALEKVDLADTLVVVTADHSHVMTLGGYATTRGNSIFGYDRKPSDIDMRPYTTLLYANGPGGINKNRKVREDRGKAIRHQDTVQRAAIPRSWATHGGEDVPVYAAGPTATELFSGSIDQTLIPHAIAYSACIGPFKDSCKNNINKLSREKVYYGVEKTSPSSSSALVEFPKLLNKITKGYVIVDKDNQKFVEKETLTNSTNYHRSSNLLSIIVFVVSMSYGNVYS